MECVLCCPQGKDTVDVGKDDKLHEGMGLCIHVFAFLVPPYPTCVLFVL